MRADAANRRSQPVVASGVVGARLVAEVVRVPDELDDYEEGLEQVEAREEKVEQEMALADAEELADRAGEEDETPFDETRHAYSGVDEDGGGIDLDELDEAGAHFDAPEAPWSDS
jgi:hypothetical protein